MNPYGEYYAAIDEIKALLFQDLIGPVEENEVLKGVVPLGYYAMGILWPQRLGQGDTAALEQHPFILSDDIEAMDDSLESDDDVIASVNTYKPSVMGISVMLPADAIPLEVEFTYGKYTMSSVEMPATEDGGKEYKINCYARTPNKLLTVFNVPTRCGTSRCKEHAQFHELGVDIALRVRKVMSDGTKLVTVTASNAIKAPQQSREQNESALFQCQLRLTLHEGFVPIYQNMMLGQSEEDQISTMQYRDVLNYAYGHGCSVGYNNDVKITEICSEFMPSEQVLQMMPGVIEEEILLRLNYWCEADRTDACKRLLRFIAEYSEWRTAQEISTKFLNDYQISANVLLSRIDTCIARLKRSVDVLQSNDDAWSAFKLMNEVMLLQRIKTKGLTIHEGEQVAWYPFQLSYILQILPDITETDSPFRDTVDLLWFPTGGGKTEAYLGVAAFVIFYRRLSSQPVSDGVTILMRYTLRLLTIQQFERASALICACESLRRRDNISGGEISIGLWIGSGMTPNHIKDADEKLKELKENPSKPIYEGNPVQITSCPWCGEPIDLDGYEISKENGLIIRCNNNPQCEFHNALPIYVVDDDIYRVRPTLVLSTIDKFARLAWEIDSRSLFGDGKCAPPELIIQDELHLISGPLGSLAGIYEIGVEFLCSLNGRYPKVIASTATVKNASEQIRNLYNKKMFQFPPSGISFSDSFFAVRATYDQRPARTYIGLCEAGGTLADLMIRVYANLIFVKSLFIKQGKSEGVIDQFSTIVGYFNAIRDLGTADNIISDRAYSYIRTLLNLKFKTESEKAGLTLSDVRIGIHDELTSRKTSKEIKETLERLALSYQTSGYYSYVLASNMLSVGIDIDRLGIMTVYNQPKSNAEYIQATSRVGRKNPGIVLSMFNSFRSRDKSHYEQFGFYHKLFYQYVEATSVTPFSARAIEKALHCVLIIMLRLDGTTLGANDYAANFRVNDRRVGDAISFILGRIRSIYPEGEDDAKAWLSAVTERWEELAEENPDTLVYSTYSPGFCSLLISAEQGSDVDFPATLNSMRNVEASANVFIQERD